ncbi:MAG: hypothetical protein AB1896_01085 [Thermodesulfobacteriota bacterium]
MCEKDESCQKPEQLKGQPQECSPEQIKQCHGEVRVHPCLTPATLSDKKKDID